ncbi:TVG0126304 [Thermoplasma volcanium GSS1]|uniref:TVG0126304 protein n=1 Tax=Thermoplasma volcanium (strain ATCC 51530 / DSM 4299 / JCM 9571 / NBRC 15438 / GSS1) TaxID=273116 RepID=Q97CI2_THEVO|nr:TVG0126304 [Thermoplasma volcanium GSS1]
MFERLICKSKVGYELHLNLRLHNQLYLLHKDQLGNDTWKDELKGDAPLNGADGDKIHGNG